MNGADQERSLERRNQTAAKIAWWLATSVAVVVTLVGFWGAQFCHGRENSSNLFVERCGTIIPYLPLIGFALVVSGYLLARALGRPWIRALSLILALGSEALTAHLLSV